jgi:hypothetical protein
VNRIPLLFALFVSVGGTVLAGDKFSDQVKGLPACDKAVPAAAPASWERATAFGGFTIALPSSCSPVVDKEPRYMHGGTRWQCGSATVEVVWGMWGGTSFGDKGTRCRTKVAGQRVLAVRDRSDEGPSTLVWYDTGGPHEPIVSAFSSRAEDAGLIAAIVFSGRTGASK